MKISQIIIFALVFVASIANVDAQPEKKKKTKLPSKPAGDRLIQRQEK